MAFVPDKAISDGWQVSPLARSLYSSYCLHREADGATVVDNEIIFKECDIKDRTFFEKRKELQTAGWIAIEGKSVRCLKGFDVPPAPRTPEPPTTTVRIGSEASPTEDVPSPRESVNEEMRSDLSKPALSLVKSIAITSGPAPEVIHKPEPTPEIVKGPVTQEDDDTPNPYADLYCKVFSLMLDDPYALDLFKKECPDMALLERSWRVWERKSWDPENYEGQVDRYKNLQAEEEKRKASAYVGAQSKPAGPTAPRSGGFASRSKYDETPPTDDELRESLHLPTSNDIREMLKLARLQYADEMKAAPIIEALKQLEYSNWNHWEDGSLPSLEVLSRMCGREVSRKEVIRAAPDFIRGEPNLPTLATQEWAKLFKEAQRYLPNIFEMTDEAFKAAIEKTVFMPIAA